MVPAPPAAAPMTSLSAPVLAALSALCFGTSLVLGRVALRHVDARAGAALSVPTATVLFVLAAPFTVDLAGFSAKGLLLFALVGLFFPALVTLLTFRSNERLGPTMTSAVFGTSPLFAILAAGLFLGERIPPQAAASALGIVAGVALLSWRREAGRHAFAGRRLALPLAGAVVRGFAQAGAKAALLVWPNPFAAIVVGYLVSSGVLLANDRLSGVPRRPPGRAGVLWVMLTGVVNGLAVLLMYAALSRAPVWQVAPIVAAYPVITVILGSLLLHDEKFSPRVVAGTLITVVAIVHLVGART